MSAVRLFRGGVAVVVTSAVLLSGVGVVAAKDAPPAPARASAARVLQVTLDGASLGAAGVDQAGGALVGLDALTVAAGWHYVRATTGARIGDQDRTLLLTIGSRMIREDGESEPVLQQPLIERSGKLYVAAADAARLFDLQLHREKDVLAFRHAQEIGSTPSVVEVPRPAPPRARSTPSPSRMATAEAATAGSDAGRIVFSLERSGGLTQLMLTSETHGSYLHTFVSSSGIGTLGVPSATVTLGTATRNVAVGALANPLGGLIMRGGVYDGVALQNGYQEAFAGRRLDDGLDYIGVSSGNPLRGGSNSLAVVTQDGGFDQIIARHFTVQRTPWGETAQELMIGDRGAGMAFSARTAGRTFLESTVAYTAGKLPLGPSDAPISIDLGRQLSDATTVTAGFAKFVGQPLSPFTGISMRSNDFVASLSLTDRSVTTALAYSTPLLHVQAYSVPGPQRTAGLQATLFLQSATVDVSSMTSGGSRDDSIEMRTLRPGVNLVAGFGDTGGKMGPIIGLSIPINKTFAVETAIRPANGSQHAIRFSLAMAVPGRRVRPLPTVPAAIRIDGEPANGAPLRLFVDGFPVRTFSSAAIAVPVVLGSHVFAVESVDGTVGSRDTTVAIAAAGDTANLTLLPERAVTGRVSLADPSLAGPDFSLAGIPIVIEPGDISVDTDADGAFVFPRQPLPPDATIGLDPGALPRTLRAPDRLSLGTGDVRIVIRSALKVQEQTFR